MVLSAHQALSTAFTNDVDPMLCYAQQLFAMGSEGDCILGISTSGNAENILNAFKVAGGMGIKRILLTGEGNGKCAAYTDCVIHAPAKETFRVQEYHLPIYHTLCMMIEERFFGKK
jgi:D-sedoheptulose 7-phosphate isomerase